MNTSRSTPPPAPVSVPMMMAVQKGKPAVMVFSTPVTVKSARPMVSKRNHVLFCRTSNLRKIITHARAMAEQIR